MTSSMSKWVVGVLLLMLCMGASAQDVRYYKLSSKRVGGSTSKDVSGGQFITFVSDLCFESNSHGVGVGHGTLTRNRNYSNAQYTTYQGASYWGNSTTFKFNADKSVLNVVLDNGDVYVYKRTTAPSGVTTCSLIRKSGGGGSGSSGGGYVPQPTYPVQQYPQQQYPQQQQPSAPAQQQQPSRITCSYCNGTGEVKKDYGGVSFSVDDRKYCSKCGTTGPQHSHVPCPSCYGKGYK